VSRTLLGTEAEHQEALVEWARLQPWFERFAHWPNERVNKAEAVKLWRAGVKPGPLDNWLFLPMGTYVGAVSELKRPGAPPSATSPEQQKWRGYLEECKFLVDVHYGWDQARDFFQGYVDGCYG
jgi:hypothetical protein